MDWCPLKRIQTCRMKRGGGNMGWGEKGGESKVSNLGPFGGAPATNRHPDVLAKEATEQLKWITASKPASVSIHVEDIHSFSLTHTHTHVRNINTNTNTNTHVNTQATITNRVSHPPARTHTWLRKRGKHSFGRLIVSRVRLWRCDDFLASDEIALCLWYDFCQRAWLSQETHTALCARFNSFPAPLISVSDLMSGRGRTHTHTHTHTNRECHK